MTTTMTPTTRYVTAMVAASSRCLCEINDDAPCWQHHTDAFSVYWYAKWSAMPVSLPATFDASGWFWSVLTPSNALYPRTTGARALHQVPAEVIYKDDGRQWSVHGSGHTQYGQSLESVLKAYQAVEHQLQSDGFQYIERSNL